MTFELSRGNDRPTTQITRRRALASLGALGLLTASSTRAIASQITATPESTPESARELVATMPDWQFSLIGMIDPYEGQITRPGPLPSGHRMVGYEVILSNNSEQPMEMKTSDIRIRDIDGVEYRAGEYLGTDSRLVSRNLATDERIRGWVWYAVPMESIVISILFVAPPPLLKIAVPS